MIHRIQIFVYMFFCIPLIARNDDESGLDISNSGSTKKPGSDDSYIAAAQKFYFKYYNQPPKSPNSEKILNQQCSSTPPKKKYNLAKKCMSKKNMDLSVSESIWAYLKASPSCWCACTAAHPCQIQSHILKPHGETWLVRGKPPSWVRCRGFFVVKKKWKCRRLAEHFFEAPI